MTSRCGVARSTTNATSLSANADERTAPSKPTTVAHHLADDCHTSSCAGQREALFGLPNLARGCQGRARPARCGRYLRRSSSLAPPAHDERRTMTERQPSCPLAESGDDLWRGPHPSHQSPASTTRVNGAPTSRHCVIGQARPWTRSAPAYDRQLRGAWPADIGGRDCCRCR
jgi:hypothetical protein